MNSNDVIKKLKWIFKSYIWLAPLIVILDQVTKLCAQNALKGKPAVTVINNFFYLDYSINPGIAWGKFKDYTPFWALLSLVAGIGMCYYLYKKYHTFNIFNRLALILMIGGCFGNMIDRMFYKGVIDFLSFHFGSYIFPTFNIADSSLVIGVIMLMIYMTFEEKIDSYFKKRAENKLVKESHND